MIIDIFPIWVLFLVTGAVILLAFEGGYSFGKYVTQGSDQELDSPVSAIAGAIVGLQAFILAFTFSIVSDRFDAKKALVREESGVIRTAWYRSEFLQEPDRSRSKLLLKQYVDNRIDITSRPDIARVEASMSDMIRIQNELWNMAVANARLDLNSDIGALYIESLNSIMDIHAQRVSIGLQSRIPSGIWSVLFGLLIFGMAGIGYHGAIAGSRRTRAVFILAISFSLIVSLIAALDHPGNTFITVSQQPMINLQTEMNSAPDVRP
jgi:hypothetical protein